ncbi:hypothetical protein HYFRA_00013157 [Hymenoscyphus fraxineus]|uniref:GH16 domain-containing protein n=1 Tax=Hymenoscyphus fraxineus TaxID=746836 RepID=A0A9N9PY03_9HELO|nr:hypothetical protein HYFRA_00013157 [Hymenoscyphus fraxineus]
MSFSKLSLAFSLLAFLPFIFATEPEHVNGFLAVWYEDFSEKSIDTNKWNIYTGDSYNNEEQKYINSPSTCTITDRGTFLIEPVKDSAGKWTSCKINTVDSFKAEPGQQIIVQARFKLGTPGSNLQGIWPAFWSLGQVMREGTQWPECGEIDTFENVNGSPLGTGTIHCGPACHDPSGLGAGITFDYGTFHTWAHAIDLRSDDWKQQSIIWYMDGQPYHKKKGADIGDEASWKALAQKAMYMTLNVSVGGTLPGASAPTTATGADAGMEIQYVAVYKSCDCLG